MNASFAEIAGFLVELRKQGHAMPNGTLVHARLLDRAGGAANLRGEVVGVAVHDDPQGWGSDVDVTVARLIEICVRRETAQTLEDLDAVGLGQTPEEQSWARLIAAGSLDRAPS